MADIYEKGRSIIEACKRETSRDPFEVFFHVAANPFVPMHGPEHHILDGACVLTAFCNAGGKTDLNEALERLLQEGVRMPGAACGLWGVCGAVTKCEGESALFKRGHFDRGCARDHRRNRSSVDRRDLGMAYAVYV